MTETRARRLLVAVATIAAFVFVACIVAIVIR